MLVWSVVTRAFGEDTKVTVNPTGKIEVAKEHCRYPYPGT